MTHSLTLFYYLCTECNCNPAGAKEVPGYPFGGCGAYNDGRLCDCKDRVGGRICDTCKDGFWNLDVRNPYGCEGRKSGPLNAFKQAALCLLATGWSVLSLNTERAFVKHFMFKLSLVVCSTVKLLQFLTINEISLQAGSLYRLTTFKILSYGPVKCGPYKQLVFMYRWSLLFSAGLHSPFPSQNATVTCRVQWGPVRSVT